MIDRNVVSLVGGGSGVAEGKEVVLSEEEGAVLAENEVTLEEEAAPKEEEAAPKLEVVRGVFVAGCTNTDAADVGGGEATVDF